jgi:hypothetical protein
MDHWADQKQSDAIKIAQQAIELDKAGDYERAFETYEKSLRHFIVALKCILLLSSPAPNE